jgi:outer membrane receptor protein involved in Fe transport
MFNLQFKKTVASFATCAAIAGALLSPGAVYAQERAMLEEITVTAQRREQSLKDVPISVQAFDGREVTRQGIISLSELSAFSPGLIVKDWSEEQGLILRGAGTQSKNLGVEQGVPTFIDGVHFGRGSQVRNSYLDLERIEVLKGPQPVFFGQNAAAGALNITTRKPTPEWEGNLSADVGNFGKTSVEGAVGGPITETFGVRVAAKYYELEGFMTDYYTGKKFPERESKTARMTLQWTPTDNFQSTLKVDWAENDLGPRVWPLVLDKYYEDPELNHPERTTIIGISATGAAGAVERGLRVGQFSDVGWVYTGPFVNPYDEVVASGIPLTEASGVADGLVLDWTKCFADGGLMIMDGGFTPYTADGIAGPEDPVVEVESRGRQPVRPSQFESCNMADESASTPWHSILDLNYTLANGVEIESKTAYSKHRFHNTPHNSGGGAFAANPRSRGEDLDQWSTELRFTSDNGRRALRAQRTSEESDWRSVFATVTFNFLGDKASLDLGGRYTGISKKAEGSNNHAEWFVIDRVEAGGDGSIVRIPAGFDIRGSSTRAQISRAILEQHPGIANGSIVGRSNMSTICTDLYGEQLNSGFISENSRCASVSATISDDSFDPQVVFRYRTSDDVSWYVKYATSFKSGAFDNGVSEVARFTTDMTGVQVSFIDRVLDRNITKNIAEQSSDGLELGLRFAASDRITLSAYAAFLDATIDKFEDAVCTEDERVTGNCREEDGPDGPAGTTDRSGADARNAPDWQLTASMQWELPTIISGLRHDLDITFLASDDYVTDRSFSRVIDMPSYEDLNVSYEIGPEAGRWSLLLYGRNLLEPTPRYNGDLDIAGDGVIGSEAQIGTTNFATYGARFTLNFD